MSTIPESEMPAPRLELRWTDEGAPFRDGYTIACVYSVVIKLGDYDIRKERVDENYEPLPNVPTHSAELGKTLSTGEVGRKWHREQDAIGTPYRDGAHAQWDAKQLGNLPIYAVACGRAMLVEPA